ncbi:hypothetical protein [Haloferula sargassicola]|uniref:Uncharacterized protein n=1 Tax=Haloferula sargassicola TaxID=490096 RepID=A0ABP9UUP4_9BACT
MTDRSTKSSRLKQILIGGAVIGVAGLVLMLISLGRFIPGPVGEWFGLLSGIISTPFLMETSLAGLGLLTVLIVNHIRERLEGDDFVYLDQIEGPGSEKLPDQARWASYARKPLDPETPSMEDLLEGAVAAGDVDEATAILATMPAEQLAARPVMELRLRLAEATGHHDLARRLREQLQAH